MRTVYSWRTDVFGSGDCCKYLPGAAELQEQAKADGVEIHLLNKWT